MLTIEWSSNPTKKEKINPWIIGGPNYTSYKALNHEKIFLRAFKKETGLKVRLKNLIKVAFQDIKTSDEYKMNYIYSRRLKPYFKSNFLQYLAGIKLISKHGIQRQIEIKRALRKLKEHYKKKNEVFEEALLTIQGNVLLLNNIPRSAFNSLKIKDQTEPATRNKKNHLMNYDFYLIAESYDHFFSQDLTISSQAAFTATLNAMPHFDQADSMSSGGGYSRDSGCAGAGCGGVGCGGH